MLSYPSGMTVSSRALNLLADTLRRHRNELATRWRKRPPAARRCWWWPTCARARPTRSWPADSRSVPRRCTGTSAKRSGCSRRWPRPSPSDRGRAPEGVRHPRRHPAADRPGRHDLGLRPGVLLGQAQVPRLNVQVIADPAGRLVWISPTLPGARHDLGAAREPGSSTRSPRPGSMRSPTPPIRAPARTWPCRSGGVASTRTPVVTDRCPRRRSRSTLRTPASAARASRSTGAEELADPAQDPLLPEPRHELVAAVQTLMITSA